MLHPGAQLQENAPNRCGWKGSPPEFAIRNNRQNP